MIVIEYVTLRASTALKGTLGKIQAFCSFYLKIMKGFKIL